MIFQLTDDSNYQKAFFTKFLHLSEGKIVMIIKYTNYSHI